MDRLISTAEKEFAMGMMNFRDEVTVVHGTDSHKEPAIFTSRTITMTVTAVVSEGDTLIRKLPNGQEGRYIATKVDVAQSPFGSKELDHTSVKYESEYSYNRGHRSSQSFTAQNMQVTAGDSYGSTTMSVGFSPEQVSDLLNSLVSVLEGQGISVEATAKEAVTKIGQGTGVEQKSRIQNVLSHLKKSVGKVADEALQKVMLFAIGVLAMKAGISI